MEVDKRASKRVGKSAAESAAEIKQAKDWSRLARRYAYQSCWHKNCISIQPGWRGVTIYSNLLRRKATKNGDCLNSAVHTLAICF